MSRLILAPSNMYRLCSSAPGGKSFFLQDATHAISCCPQVMSSKSRFKVMEKGWRWKFYVNRPIRCPSVTGFKEEPQATTAPCPLIMAVQRGPSAGERDAEPLGTQGGWLEKPWTIRCSHQGSAGQRWLLCLFLPLPAPFTVPHKFSRTNTGPLFLSSLQILSPSSV